MGGPVPQGGAGPGRGAGGLSGRKQQEPGWRPGMQPQRPSSRGEAAKVGSAGSRRLMLGVGLAWPALAAAQQPLHSHREYREGSDAKKSSSSDNIYSGRIPLDRRDVPERYKFTPKEKEEASSSKKPIAPASERIHHHLATPNTKKLFHLRPQTPKKREKQKQKNTIQEITQSCPRNILARYKENTRRTRSTSPMQSTVHVSWNTKGASTGRTLANANWPPTSGTCSMGTLPGQGCGHC